MSKEQTHSKEKYEKIKNYAVGIYHLENAIIRLREDFIVDDIEDLMVSVMNKSEQLHEGTENESGK